MPERSLSSRILATVLTAELLSGVLFSSIALLHERSARYHALDVMLHGRADSLVSVLEDQEDPADTLRVNTHELSLPAEDAYLVLDEAGNPIGRSPDWNDRLRLPDRDGYTTVRVDGVPFRVLREHGARIVDAEEDGGVRRSVTVLYATPLTHFWHSIFETVRFYIVSTLILLAATAFLLAAAMRRVLRPLEDLARQARGVTPRTWRFEPSPEVLRTRELKPLATSIQTLLANLEREFAERRRFVSDAAHELKTELAVIKSSLQLLDMRHRTTEEYHAGLERSIENTARMEVLVHRMLTLGRVDEGPNPITPGTDLRAALERILRRLEPLAQLRGVRMTVEAPAPACVALSTADAETLCSNLLSNAIEHSMDSRIVATLSTLNGSALLRIIDRGEGIPPEALPHVFDRFFRVDKSRTRQTGGSGLGLSICRGIVSSAGGVIRLNSTLGQGTTVAVDLPLASQPSTTAEAEEATQGAPSLT